MSWLFSRALVEAFSEDTCSAGALFALLSGTPTPQAFCAPDRMTAFSRPSRFGMTFGLLTDGLGAEGLTWCLADSLARTSASPARATDSTESEADSGPKWRGSLARYDHDSRSWKTAQHSLLGGSDEFSETWPRWGTTRGGELFLLPMPALRTSENESGLWQTPVADDAVERKAGKWNSRGEPKLSAEVKLWPTPLANFHTGAGQGPNKQGAPNLQTVVAAWPTPVASMSKGSSPAALTRKSGKSRENDRLDHKVMATDGGQLNPTWVEWLMGWPLGWTDLQPSATDKYRTPLHSHGDCSEVA